MIVIKSKHGGFCFGVKRAVDQAFELKGKRNFVLGEIIHNEFINEKLKNAGIITLESIDNPSLKKGDTLLISSIASSTEKWES